MEKNLKTYDIDGKKMQFNTGIFKNLFHQCRVKRNLNITDYEIELGDEAGVDKSTIHAWRSGQNGPADIEIIKKLAIKLEVSDYKLLLQERKDKMIMQISERQKDSLKRIYDAVIEFLDEFQQTDGFNDYWLKFCDMGINPKKVESKLYDVAEEKQHKVEVVLLKEYIELHNLPVYSQLEDYVYDDLCDTYNEKLSYAYRFEASVENVDGTRSGVTTLEDYARALNRINELMVTYM